MCTLPLKLQRPRKCSSAFIVHLISGRLFDSQTIVNYSSTCLRGRGGSLLMRAVRRLHLFPEYINSRDAPHGFLGPPLPRVAHCEMIDGRDGGENGEMDFDSISCVWRNYISLLSTSERETESGGWREGRLASISWFNVHFLFICSPFPAFLSSIIV